MEVTVDDYRFLFFDRTVVVGGPFAPVCDAMQERINAICQSSDANEFLKSDQLAGNIQSFCWFLKHKAKFEGVATDAQKQYARSLGYVISDDISRAEVSFILDDFEAVRLGVHIVCQTVTDTGIHDHGVPRENTQNLILQILKDRPLATRLIHAVRTETLAVFIDSRNEQGRFQKGSGQYMHQVGFEIAQLLKSKLKIPIKL